MHNKSKARKQNGNQYKEEPVTILENRKPAARATNKKQKP